MSRQPAAPRVPRSISSASEEYAEQFCSCRWLRPVGLLSAALAEPGLSPTEQAVEAEQSSVTDRGPRAGCRAGRRCPLPRRRSAWPGVRFLGREQADQRRGVDAGVDPEVVREAVVAVGGQRPVADPVEERARGSGSAWPPDVRRRRSCGPGRGRPRAPSRRYRGGRIEQLLRPVAAPARRWPAPGRARPRTRCSSAEISGSRSVSGRSSASVGVVSAAVARRCPERRTQGPQRRREPLEGLRRGRPAARAPRRARGPRPRSAGPSPCRRGWRARRRPARSCRPARASSALWLAEHRRQLLRLARGSGASARRASSTFSPLPCMPSPSVVTSALSPSPVGSSTVLSTSSSPTEVAVCATGMICVRFQEPGRRGCRGRGRRSARRGG